MLAFWKAFLYPGVDFASILGWSWEVKNLVSICILQYILDFGHSRMRLGLKSNFFRFFSVLEDFGSQNGGQNGELIDKKRDPT